MDLWEDDAVHAKKFLSNNTTGVPQCGSDLGRGTKVPAQNIVALVARKGFCIRKHRFKDHVRRRELVQNFSK